jgi:hypothetical protein
MFDAITDLDRAIFAKTEIGRQEIQSRGLGLSPLVRRLLILVDGKRSTQELVPLIAGQGLGEMLKQLFDQQCIELVNKNVLRAPVNPLPQQPEVAQAKPAATGLAETTLAALPDAEFRSAKDAEMARNFMTNTINAMFGQHMCLSMIESISACDTSAALRQVYPAWYELMSSNRSAAKELPTLNEKLARVL